MLWSDVSKNYYPPEAAGATEATGTTAGATEAAGAAGASSNKFGFISLVWCGVVLYGVVWSCAVS